MNQPASKEPTMDEILSSIRQIIADDDEAAAQHVTAAKPANTPATAPSPVAAVPDPEPRQPTEEPAAPAAPAAQAAPSRQEEHAAPRPQDAIDPFSDDDEDDLSPLALSPEQIVEDGEAESEASETDFDSEETWSAASEPAAGDAEDEGQDHAPDPADLVMPDDVAFEPDETEDMEADFGMDAHRDYAEPDPEPGPSYSDAAPMPDSDLSRDLAEELLEPTTKAAVRDAFSRLNTPRLQPETPIGAGGLTIEAMLREMLRPMLKDWLDENLPAMVERLVEQEIERASRGSR